LPNLTLPHDPVAAPNRPLPMLTLFRAGRVTVKQFLGALALIALFTGPAFAQEKPESAPTAFSNANPNPWEFSFTSSGYIVPGGQSYVNPVLTANRCWPHLEARYNSEAFNTGSLWVGYNFSKGKKLVLTFTPMVSGVFGNLNGFAPGHVITLTDKRVQLHSQGEYVFDAQNRGGSVFSSCNHRESLPSLPASSANCLRSPIPDRS
jgi:hypothetical protein